MKWPMRRTLAEIPPPNMFRWTLHVWANVNAPGGFNRFHTHAGSTWSGVYYVDPGTPPDDTDEGTPLHFFDPCLGRANTLPAADFAVQTLGPTAAGHDGAVPKLYARHGVPLSGQA
jgi:hypothetical protein